MSTITAFLIACQASYLLTSHGSRAPGHSPDPFPSVLKALIQVESGGDPAAVGDGGRAIGVLQIHKIMVDDCNRIMGRKQWSYQDRRDPAKSAQMLYTCCQHYERDSGPEEWARLWNGGPGWRTKKQLTDNYWFRVKKVLDSQAK